MSVLAFAPALGVGARAVAPSRLACARPAPPRRARRGLRSPVRATAAGSVHRRMGGNVPAGAASGIEDLPLEGVPPVGEPLPETWARPGVYGVYDNSMVLVYIATAKDVRDAVGVHRRVIADERKCYAVRMITVDQEEDAPLDKLAYNWLVAHTQEGPGPPWGNTAEGSVWQDEGIEAGADAVYFQEGSGADGESVDSEIRRLLRSHRVLLFMKGTRSQPQCGFSDATVRLLENRCGRENFECVNCLDDLRNRGLRDGIKTYGDWPTIPQLYINGDFVGGADIVAEMDHSGDLAKELAQAGVQGIAT